MEFVPLLPTLHMLGEGPSWSPAEAALWFVDIPALRIHRVDWATRAAESWAMPSEPGSLAPIGDGTVVVALRDGFHHFDPSTRRLQPVALPGHDTRALRFNDGRCDPAGRFWAGSMDTTRAGPNGALWCLDRGRLVAGPGGVTISNGLAFSLDGRWMHHADSAAREIYRYAYDPATGAVGERSVWFRCPEGCGAPDGASFDAEGFYWIAMYGGACLLRIAPDGVVDRRMAVPAACPTMVGFAGPDLDTMVVTTSRHGRPADELAALPLSGAVLVADAGVRGVAEAPYRAPPPPAA